MKKSFFVLITAVVLTITLASCGATELVGKLVDIFLPESNYDEIKGDDTDADVDADTVADGEYKVETDIEPAGGDSMPETKVETEYVTEQNVTTEAKPESIPEPTPEPEPEITADIVGDVVSLDRDVIPIYEGIGMEGVQHKIHIPGLKLESENAKAFNQNIYVDHEIIYDLVRNYEEKELVFTVSYKHKVYDGLVAIMVVATEGPQAAGLYARNLFYYYDVKNDRELSFDEYLSALGFTYDELNTKLKLLESLDGYGHSCVVDHSVLDGCLIDENSTMVAFSEVDSMGGNVDYEVPAIVG